MSTRARSEAWTLLVPGGPSRRRIRLTSHQWDLVCNHHGGQPVSSAGRSARLTPQQAAAAFRGLVESGLCATAPVDLPRSRRPAPDAGGPQAQGVPTPERGQPVPPARPPRRGLHRLP